MDVGEYRSWFPPSRGGGVSQYRCLNVNRGYPEWLPRATAFDQRGSLGASSEPCSHDVYGCLYARGRGCTLQQRPPSARGLTPRPLPPSARGLTPRPLPRRSGGAGGGREGGGGRPLSSAHEKLEETRGEKALGVKPRRPVTAPEGRGRSREPNQGAPMGNPVAFPKSPCVVACDTVHGRQVDAGRGVSTPTLHLYLPSSRWEEEEEDDTGSENSRPIQEDMSLQHGADGIDAQTLSERPGTRDLSNRMSPQDPAETLRMQEHAFLSALQDPSDDIRPQDSGEEVRSLDPMGNHGLQEITACLPAPKPCPHGRDTARGKICNPLLITPAAVHKGRPHTSARHRVSYKQGLDGLPKIKTTKTLVWGFHGPREVKSVCVLQDCSGRSRRTNQT